MKDYKVLLGWASILFAVGFVVRSVAIAYASPYGPNVSMGSNPIINIAIECNNQTSTSWTNTTTQVAILNSFQSKVGIHIMVDEVIKTISPVDHTSLTTGIVVKPLEVLTCHRYSNNYTIPDGLWIQGYYTHP